ncbi:MAG TPA: DUF1360 domain-containing protein [Candidatus Angelobacter sp.]|nr:DUF1360 domain-containing protein [Candidatus Angelobacter sp.]
MNTFYYLILGVLGVWRITHLLNAEDGPGKILVRLRELAGSGFWGELLDCFYCLSLWVALPFALLTGSSWREKLLLWLALSGAAILLEGMHRPSLPRYLEESPAAQDAKEGHQ